MRQLNEISLKIGGSLLPQTHPFSLQWSNIYTSSGKGIRTEKVGGIDDNSQYFIIDEKWQGGRNRHYNSQYFFENE